jgi:putative ABC transport system permease protein
LRSLQSYVDETAAETRFALFVLGAFSLIAMALTAVGVYGVVAYATARRTREIAVRLALGADPLDIVALVVRAGAAWTAAGSQRGRSARWRSRPAARTVWRSHAPEGTASR